MSGSGDAADQVVKMTLEGIELVAKLSGIGAKNLATYLYAVLTGQKQTRGRARLQTMISQNSELKVFSVKREDLKEFTKEAKTYGVLFCALRDKKNIDGMCDVMVRAEDAGKVDRIVERFKLAVVDTAAIKTEIVRSRAEKQEQSRATPAEKNTEAFIDELMKKPESKDAPAKEQAVPANPTPLRTSQLSRSESSCERSAARGGSSDERRSVREELREIKAQSEAAKEKAPAQHKEAAKTKQKTKKTKER